MRGFTLIELLITLAIIALMATMIAPTAEVAYRHEQEAELRRNLNGIRDALDAYKVANDAGRIKRDASVGSGFPSTLDALAEGVEDQRDPEHRKIYFLRRIPRDPFFPDSAVSNSDTWGKRSYASEPTEPQEGDDVFDVYSQSAQTGLNGVAYKQW